MTAPGPALPLIAIYGASGTTGAMVAAELVRRGHRVRLVGRDRTRLESTAAELVAHDRRAPGPPRSPPGGR